MKRETRNNTMQGKSSGTVRHREAKAAAERYSRKERIQGTVSHGGGDT